jgi:hypothetical protein
VTLSQQGLVVEGVLMVAAIPDFSLRCFIDLRLALILLLHGVMELAGFIGGVQRGAHCFPSGQGYKGGWQDEQGG